MPYNTILQEVDRLKRVSGRLELLANEHSSVTEALMSISGSVLGIATVLEVLGDLKIGSATSLIFGASPPRLGTVIVTWDG